MHKFQMLGWVFFFIGIVVLGVAALILLNAIRHGDANFLAFSSAMFLLSLLFILGGLSLGSTLTLRAYVDDINVVEEQGFKIVDSVDGVYKLERPVKYGATLEELGINKTFEITNQSDSSPNE